MPGGWQPSDVDDPSVVEAAQFALTAMLSQQPSEQNAYPYSFTLVSTHQYKPVIVEASQQVVAGMNFRLTILIQDTVEGKCVGAFTTTIYNHFGQLSVTDWGDEMTCKVAQGISAAQKLEEP